MVPVRQSLVYGPRIHCVHCYVLPQPQHAQKSGYEPPEQSLTANPHFDVPFAFFVHLHYV